MFTAHPLIDAMHAVHGIPPVVRLTRETPHDMPTIPKPGVLARWRAFRIPMHIHARTASRSMSNPETT